MKKARPSQSKITSSTSLITDKTVVCIIGLGYVGLPLAQAFARTLPVIGFDINPQKVHEANRHVSPITNYASQITHPPSPTFTTDPLKIGQADFIIIAVPTPVTRFKEPDLSYVVGAAQIAGRNMKKGSTVILESTVYPGVTEDVVKPVLEKKSGFRCGRDFKIAYSPERINPGDREHTLDRITKVGNSSYLQSEGHKNSRSRQSYREHPA